MTKRSRFVLVLALAALIAGAPGCGIGDSASPSMAGAADMGATPGGAQDTGLPREQIDQGLVPQPEDFTIEGMLNEHDLPLEAPPCERDFCIRAAYGIAPALDTGRAAVFVQMGFASGIDPATFKRAPLNLAVVVDRSGSMGGEKIEAVRTALSRLVDQLGEADRLAIVLFDDQVDVLLESTPVTDREAIRARLGEIWARGSTDMASGLRAGYAQVAANAGVPGVSDRVMVFTDAMTNTGDTDTTTFIELAGANAAAGIGLTVFGVGVDLNQQLVLAISKLRGGNYFFLSDAEKIATVFDVDFDYLVTPLAYDLEFRLEPKPGFRIAQVYGYPSWQAGGAAVTIEVATVFLSRNHGALVARLEADGTWPLGKPPLAELSLSYAPRDGGERVSESLVAAYSADEALHDSTVFYSQRAVRKTVALINAALAMRGACERYWQGDLAGAQELLAEGRELLLAEWQALEDAELLGEADEVQRLSDNMGTAPDGYYDPYYPGDYYYDDYYDYEPHGLACSAGGAAPAASAGLLAAVALALMLCLRRRG